MKTVWHKWFAWRPVKTLSNEWIWLKKIVREYREDGYVYSKITPTGRIDERVKNPFFRGDLRNKLCPCMSNKKLKNCHGREEFIDRTLLDKFLTAMYVREQQ